MKVKNIQKIQNFYTQAIEKVRKEPNLFIALKQLKDIQIELLSPENALSKVNAKINPEEIATYFANQTIQALLFNLYHTCREFGVCFLYQYNEELAFQLTDILLEWLNQPQKIDAATYVQNINTVFANLSLIYDKSTTETSKTKLKNLFITRDIHSRMIALYHTYRINSNLKLKDTSDARVSRAQLHNELAVLDGSGLNTSLLDTSSPDIQLTLHRISTHIRTVAAPETFYEGILKTLIHSSEINPTVDMSIVSVILDNAKTEGVKLSYQLYSDLLDVISHRSDIDKISSLQHIISGLSEEFSKLKKGEILIYQLCSMNQGEKIKKQSCENILILAHIALKIIHILKNELKLNKSLKSMEKIHKVFNMLMKHELHILLWQDYLLFFNNNQEHRVAYHAKLRDKLQVQLQRDDLSTILVDKAYNNKDFEDYKKLFYENKDENPRTALDYLARLMPSLAPLNEIKLSEIQQDLYVLMLQAIIRHDSVDLEDIRSLYSKIQIDKNPFSSEIISSLFNALSRKSNLTLEDIDYFLTSHALLEDQNEDKLTRLFKNIFATYQEDSSEEQREIFTQFALAKRGIIANHPIRLNSLLSYFATDMRLLKRIDLVQEACAYLEFKQLTSTIISELQLRQAESTPRLKKLIAQFLKHIETSSLYHQAVFAEEGSERLKNVWHEFQSTLDTLNRLDKIMDTKLYRIEISKLFNTSHGGNFVSLLQALNILQNKMNNDVEYLTYSRLSNEEITRLIIEKNYAALMLVDKYLMPHDTWYYYLTKARIANALGDNESTFYWIQKAKQAFNVHMKHHSKLANQEWFGINKLEYILLLKSRDFQNAEVIYHEFISDAKKIVKLDYCRMLILMPQSGLSAKTWKDNQQEIERLIEIFEPIDAYKFHRLQELKYRFLIEIEPSEQLLSEINAFYSNYPNEVVSCKLLTAMLLMNLNNPIPARTILNDVYDNRYHLTPRESFLLRKAFCRLAKIEPVFQVKLIELLELQLTKYHEASPQKQRLQKYINDFKNQNSQQFEEAMEEDIAISELDLVASKITTMEGSQVAEFHTLYQRTQEKNPRAALDKEPIYSQTIDALDLHGLFRLNKRLCRQYDSGHEQYFEVSGNTLTPFVDN